MPEIDIPVDPELEKLFAMPKCIDVKLPSPKQLSIQLPSGGRLKAISDLSKAIPTDCSLTFNLLLQLGPLLASIECLIKILKLLKPLIDVIQGLPMPPVKALQEFAKAAVDLAPCLLIPTPAAIIPFIRDILCLIIKVLNCFLGQLKTLIGVMRGLELQFLSAAGNPEVLASLQCAQENAAASGQQILQSMEPVGAILDLVGPLMGIAGVEPIQLPALGSATDLQSLQQVVQTIQGVVGTLQIVVDALGGCP